MGDKMPAHKLLPPDSELRKMVDQGLTHAEIAAECERITGHKVARSTVSAALSRASMTQREGHRFFETLPWRVQPGHTSEYPARMLRLLGRRRENLPLDDDMNQRLDSWLAMLERERLIVAYCPESEDGFLYVDESYRSGPNEDVPIRVQVIRETEIAS